MRSTLIIILLASLALSDVSKVLNFIPQIAGIECSAECMETEAEVKEGNEKGEFILENINSFFCNNIAFKVLTRQYKYYTSDTFIEIISPPPEC